MDPWPILGRLLLAAFLGVVGQLIRVVVGLKKEIDQAGSMGKMYKDNFNSKELLLSLALAMGVGAIAGVLSAIVTASPTSALTSNVMIGLMAAGYSGTDFIEGFMKKHGANGPAQAAGAGGQKS